MGLSLPGLPQGLLDGEEQRHVLFALPALVGGWVHGLVRERAVGWVDEINWSMVVDQRAIHSP